jgi:hypothetical protein
MERRGRMRSVETGADAARVPPHDLDAERAVIGALLVSETAVAAVAEQLTAEEFYSETHRIIYAAMMRLYSRGDRIDQITLTNELNSINEFDRVGGRAYVFQLVESVPTASNAARYAEIVRGKALLRSVIDVGSRITEDAFREPEDVTEALDSAEQLIYNVSNNTLKQHLAPVSQLAPGALEMIQRLYEQEGEVTGVETGFEDLDRLTTGFHKSDLVVLAARPAMGKTAMALNAIWHASGEKKMPVAIFSLEMSKEQLVQRLISQTTRIPAQSLRSGNVKARTGRSCSWRGAGERGSHLDRRHGGRHVDGDAGQGAAARQPADRAGRAAALAGRGGLPAAHDRAGQPQRQPPAGDSRDQPRPQGLARDLDVPCWPSPSSRAPSSPATTSAPCSRTSATRAPSSRTRTW